MTHTTEIIELETGDSRPLAVSITEAGRLLGVSRDLVYDMVARHELGSVRLGRRIVVPVRAIEAILGQVKEEVGG